MNVEMARAQMLGQQIRAWEVLDARVLGVLERTPREQFMPAEYRELAFADTEIPIGHGQYTLAPKLEGRLLQALRIEPIDRVLEIGSGSGYLTACLGRLGQGVHSIDLFSDFVEGARVKLAENGIYNVELNVADAMKMSPAEQFDAIAITASMPELDERFIEWLRPEGRLFAVVGRAPAMEARLVTMHAGGHATHESLFETVIAPLISADRPEPFVL
jgi:protein-L-isoaspartate(D-aspartate) O-methyltransferase